MAKRKKKDHDFSVLAYRVVEQATSEAKDAQSESEPQKTEGKNPHAVVLGRLGGKKGGIARSKKLTAERRSEIARKAARARWALEP